MVRVYYGDHFEHPSTHEHLTTPETVAKFLNLFLRFILMVGNFLKLTNPHEKSQKRASHTLFRFFKGFGPLLTLVIIQSS